MLHFSPGCPYLATKPRVGHDRAERTLVGVVRLNYDVVTSAASAAGQDGNARL
jgi:hypothetical protein